MNIQDAETRGNAALDYLTDTDAHAAELKADAERALARYKAYCNAHYLTLTGTVEERKRSAERESEPLYLDYIDAMQKAEAIANTRRSKALEVDWCRSLCSNMRQGK